LVNEIILSYRCSACRYNTFQENSTSPIGFVLLTSGMLSGVGLYLVTKMTLRYMLVPSSVVRQCKETWIEVEPGRYIVPKSHIGGQLATYAM